MFILLTDGRYFGTCVGALETLNGGKPPILPHTAGLSKHAAVFFHLCHSGVVNVLVQRVLEQKKESSLFQIRLG